MVRFKPFRALRPIPDLAASIAAPTYDVLSTEEVKRIVERNPLSFLRVTRPEASLEEGRGLEDLDIYLKAKESLQELIDKKYLLEDSRDFYYIYRLIKDGRSQTGLVGLAAIDDYLEGRIKKHENTRLDKEEERTRHIEATGANTGPVFLIHRSNSFLRDTLGSITSNYPPLYDFTSEDGIGHSIWIVDNSFVASTITRILAGMEKLYIADGHHRAASALRVGLEKRAEKPDYNGEEGFNYFLCLIFSEAEVQLLPYNRLVSDLGKYSAEGLLEAISKKFIINKDKTPYKPREKYHFGMYLDKNWYELVAKQEMIKIGNPLENLDVAILQDQLLDPILGIEDPRTSPRIDFVGGSRGLRELERRVGQDMEVAFSLYPTGIEELMEISELDQVMPPKSTWFEPKPRSGLIIYRLNQGDFKDP